jgi:alpha-glucoside transport system substrate-binding protein
VSADVPSVPLVPSSTPVGRRTVLRAAGLAAAVPLFAACDAVDNLFALNTIRVAVTWSDAELAAFRSVVDAFHAAHPAYQVDVIPFGDDIADALSAGANGRPDVVMMPRPGLVTEDLAQLAPLPDGVWRADSLAPEWRDLVSGPNPGGGGSVPYGLPFKVANQSALWYRKDLFDRYGLDKPDSWTEWLRLNDFLIERGVAPLALGAGDGWPLSGFFDNVLRGFSSTTYDELVAGRDVWQRGEFAGALGMLGNMLSVRGALSGGVERCLAQQFPDAIVEVFGYGRAAMVVSADFAEPIIKEFLRPPAEYDVVRFPTVEGTAPLVIGADIAVLPAPAGDGAKAFVRWLAGPDAPKPWIRDHGGFIAANKQTKFVYSTAVEKLASPVNDGTFAFDLSDSLGSLGGSGALWQVLEDFLRTVGDGRTDLVAEAAEVAAARMHALEVDHGR